MPAASFTRAGSHSLSREPSTSRGRATTDADRKGCVLQRSLVVLSLVALVSCGDDATEPRDRTDLALLEGAWNAVSITTEGLTIPVADGNIYWYFDDRGRFCDKYRTAWGSYNPVSCGQVSAELMLSEGLPDSTVRTWRLSFAATTDTLRAVLVAAVEPAPDSMTLERAEDRTDADCFCE